MVGGEGDPTTGKLRIKKSKNLTGIAIHHSGNRLIVGSWVRGFAGPQTKTPETPLATVGGEGVEPLPLV
jgi:hypothetical protein